jgi:hypothetical protein
MGIHVGFASFRDSEITEREELRAENAKLRAAAAAQPDPTKFRIMDRRLSADGKYTALVAIYDGCTNYEGVKLLIMRGNWLDRKVDRLDPHFNPGSAVVARFSPDQAGTDLASDLFGFRVGRLADTRMWDAT